jgi:hypothetical protein
MPSVTHFYVVTDAGTCIYSKSNEVKEDHPLLPGFMTAMGIFTRKILSGDLESVSIGKSRYFIVGEHGLLFIARTDLGAKDSVVRKELEELRNMFFAKFPAEEYSGNWDTIMDIFLTLDLIYDRFFKESDEKMREAIW